MNRRFFLVFGLWSLSAACSVAGSSGDVLQGADLQGIDFQYGDAGSPSETGLDGPGTPQNDSGPV